MLEQFLQRLRTTLHGGDKGSEGNSLPKSRLTKVARLAEACLASSLVILRCQLFMPELNVVEEFEGGATCGVTMV